MRLAVQTIILPVLLLLLVPAHALTVGPNVDATASNDVNSRQQVEPTIAIHPLKPNIIVAGAQDLRLFPQTGHRWHGYYRSTDGGQTWMVSLVPGFQGDTSSEGIASPLKSFDLTTDPVIAIDRRGTVYYAGLGLSLTSGASGLFIARYVNDGADYAGVTVVEGFGDYPKIVVDNTGGPHDGNLYLASTLGYSRSTDGGLSFSHPVPFPHQEGRLPPFRTGVTVAPDGDVFLVAVSTREDPQTGLFIDSISVAKLTQGGVAPVLTTTAADNISILFQLPENRFRVFTLPEIAADNSGVYVTWCDFRTGDSDVLLARSTDDGATWTSPLRVNDVAAGHQFFPTIRATAGVVRVAWYDSRLDDGGTIENLDVFYAQSTDAASSFSAGTRVTEVSFDPNLVRRTDFPNRSQPFIGDYISMDGTATTSTIIWTDNRNACGNIDPRWGCVDQDVFVATITT